MTATAEGENDQDSLGFFAPARVQLTEDIDEEEAEEGKEEKEAGIDVGTKAMQYLKHRGLHGGAIKPSTTAQAQAQAQAQAHAHAPLAPSLSDVQADSLAVRAARVWAWGEPLSPAAGDAYTLTQVLDLWSLELLKSNFSIRKVMLLEYTRCLEQVRAYVCAFGGIRPI